MRRYSYYRPLSHLDVLKTPTKQGEHSVER
jgi:hypothetical protein